MCRLYAYTDARLMAVAFSAFPHASRIDFAPRCLPSGLPGVPSFFTGRGGGHTRSLAPTLPCASFHAPAPTPARRPAAGGGSCQTSWSWSARAGPRFPPQDARPDQADPLQLGTPASSSINVTDDLLDYFQAPVDQGVTYKITISDSCVAGAGLYLSGSVGEVSLIDTSYIAAPSVDTLFVITPLLAGTLVIRLQGYAGPCTYRLLVAKE